VTIAPGAPHAVRVTRALALLSEAKLEPHDPADWVWAEPQALRVRAEFQRLIPVQPRGEYVALSESIKGEGCRELLVVSRRHGVVLDGQTQRQLSIEHGKLLKVTDVATFRRCHWSRTTFSVAAPLSAGANDAYQTR
jgi:hypothetical protein